MNANWRLRSLYCVTLSAAFSLQGCERAPAVDILGSFFPIWLVCFAVAVVLTAASRALLLRFHLKVDLPVLVYPSLTAFLTFALWSIFFH